MINLISNYFKKTSNYSVGRFIFEMYLLAILIKVILIVFMLIAIVIYEPIEYFLFGETGDSESQFDHLNWVSALLIICLILPVIESIVGQGIPILFLSYMISNKVMLVICSSLWFTYLHNLAFESVAYAIIIFFAGIIFAWCFIAYKKKGFWKAITISTIVHSLYNFTVLLTMYFGLLS